ncbi:hypothetical protein D7D52_21055 [Nocardia yunnanensis]|uniref:Uncharacterized protein n=1 Tax=Nocardia yunnanensis TaxID=2382165 RepID=A0A386ZFJ8_9NOCA|nr:hypothetical protein [Nocardia yunnanensis]AYF75914.1 hypothetical protein D7D52_21055 [Nocardia yunnanensis]
MTSSSVRIRRLTARLAIAGALTAVPLAALAIPASASTDTGVPVVSQIADPDWNHNGGDPDHRGAQDHRGDQDHRDRPGDGDRGPDQPQQPSPLPSTGSFG